MILQRFKGGLQVNRGRSRVPSRGVDIIIFYNSDDNYISYIAILTKQVDKATDNCSSQVIGRMCEDSILQENLIANTRLSLLGGSL